MNKIEQFRITGMTISGFKSYEGPTELTFGDPTVITGGNAGDVEVGEGQNQRPDKGNGGDPFGGLLEA